MPSRALEASPIRSTRPRLPGPCCANPICLWSSTIRYRASCKLLIERRETLVEQRTATVNRVQWRIHELEPVRSNNLKPLIYAKHRDPVAAWLAKQAGLVAELAFDELDDIARLTQLINALEKRIVEHVRLHARHVLVVCPANNWQLIGMISGMSKPVPALTVTDGQREVLKSLARSQSGAHREVVRAKALLMAADGAANATIAATLSVSRTTVANWRTRFAEDGLVKFGQVREGRGRKPSIPDATIEKIVTLTKQCRPEGETHWSTRTMAGVAGVSKSTVQRVWAELGLKPHRVDTFKVSNDPKFEEKLVDVVGLYLNPPENAIVLCADEKSSVQALDRTQASLPMTKGRGQTMTHDYKRNGTTTLFAALNVLTGMVIGQCLPRHRHQEFLKFLRTIDREVPTGLQVHLILDNYGTHKHADVQHWLDKHPRFHLHFTPTSSSWLNQVERWFRELTDKALRRGAFGSVPDLIAAIQEYIDAHNKDPKPYVWTATAESILAKVARARATLDTVN